MPVLKFKLIKELHSISKDNMILMRSAIIFISLKFQTGHLMGSLKVSKAVNYTKADILQVTYLRHIEFY